MKTFSNYINESVQEPINLYFDTEFTGLTKNADLISIGLVADNGSTFYAEFTDFDISKCNGWVLDNIVTKMKYYNKTDYTSKSFLKKDPRNYVVVGNKNKIKHELINWLTLFKAPKINMVADCLMWDWVLFADLIADYSSGSPVFPCNIFYIPTEICTIMIENGLDPDLDRAEYVAMSLEEKEGLHNSLSDAITCKKVFYKLKDIQ